jgi:cysteinyl-tRNA synthetase
MIAGARVEVAPYKRDATDFVLWKPSADGGPGWDSPWGRGRPGWHIECSAMARDLLGGEFDIHGGGLDLQFPHHENEIAQSACVGDSLARVWVHNEMLMVDGRKMSKSLGNFLTVRDLLDEGVPGDSIRLALLSAQYERVVDWHQDNVKSLTASIDLWRLLAKGVAETEPHQEIVSGLQENLQTGRVISLLRSSTLQEDRGAFRASVKLLGFELESVSLNEVEIFIERMMAFRAELRRRKEYKWSDQIRERLQQNAIIVSDTKDGGFEFHIDQGSLILNYMTMKTGGATGVFTAETDQQVLLTYLKAVLSDLVRDLETRFPDTELAR